MYIYIYIYILYIYIYIHTHVSNMCIRSRFGWRRSSHAPEQMSRMWAIGSRQEVRSDSSSGSSGSSSSSSGSSSSCCSSSSCSSSKPFESLRLRVAPVVYSSPTSTYPRVHVSPAPSKSAKESQVFKHHTWKAAWNTTWTSHRWYEIRIMARHVMCYMCLCVALRCIECFSCTSSQHFSDQSFGSQLSGGGRWGFQHALTISLLCTYIMCIYIYIHLYLYVYAYNCV